MKKQFLLVFAVVLLGFSGAAAQESPAKVKQISGGVLNGKATRLEKPAYPAAARAVYAQGAVNVKVTIDEDGSVIEAEAVSGHPLLQTAAAQAARQSKFKPTFLGGQPVKVTGVIVYNFIAPDRPANWIKAGLELSSLQNIPSLIFLDLNSIDKVLAADWESEREQLKRLVEIKQAEILKVNSPAAADEKTITDSAEKQTETKAVSKVFADRLIKAGNMPSAEQAAISQSLTASLQSRLGADELNLWRFNTGVSLNQAMMKLRFPNELQRLDSFRNQIRAAPAGILPEVISDLQKILAILEKQNLNAEDQHEFALLMTKVSKQ